MYNDYQTIYQTSIIDMFWVYFVVIAVLSVLFITLYGLSLVFKKASFKQVWAFIPFYNLYKLLEMCGLEKINMLLIFIPIVNIYTLVRIAIEVGDCFNMSNKFKTLLFFLPLIAYPILGLTKVKYVGINNKKVKGIYIEELTYEKVESVSESEIIKRDMNIGMGSNTFARKENNETDNILRADVNILNQPKKVEEEYSECPKCHNKVKKSANVCFFCGEKLNN